MQLRESVAPTTMAGVSTSQAVVVRPSGEQTDRQAGTLVMLVAMTESWEPLYATIVLDDDGILDSDKELHEAIQSLRRGGG